MTSAEHFLPQGGIEFLDRAGWGGCAINPIPGDASDRRYFRLTLAGEGALLMHSPPPNEDPRPFLHVGHWLNANRLRAPQIMAEDADAGWILLEDFGNDRMRDWLDANPHGEEGAYRAAIDALVPLHRLEPGPFAPYDMPTYLREARLFIEWFCPAQNLTVDDAGFEKAWNQALEPVVERQGRSVTVLRDYHAENIMLINPSPDGSGEQGIIDFQDALVGHPAYDLVSLLQDARRDVDPVLERRMLDRYLSQVDEGEHFEADYALLGAQRNAKIIGIFTRLFKRDGKARYPAFIPRVWDALERDLQHPALGPVAQWFDKNVPRALRETKGGSIT